MTVTYDGREKGSHTHTHGVYLRVFHLVFLSFFSLHNPHHIHFLGPFPGLATPGTYSTKRRRPAVKWYRRLSFKRRPSQQRKVTPPNHSTHLQNHGRTKKNNNNPLRCLPDGKRLDGEDQKEIQLHNNILHFFFVFLCASVTWCDFIDARRETFL